MTRVRRSGVLMRKKNQGKILHGRVEFLMGKGSIWGEPLIKGAFGNFDLGLEEG